MKAPRSNPHHPIGHPVARLTLAVGSDLDTALSTALSHGDRLGRAAMPSPIVILGPSAVQSATWRQDAGLLAALLRRRHPAVGVRIVSPPSPGRLARMLLPRRGSPSDWATLNLEAGGERLGRATVPRSIVEAGALVILSTVGTPNSRAPLALGVAAGHVHPRQALAFRLAPDRLGLQAALAGALRPRLVVLTGDVDGRPLAACADDLIAAELLGLALRQEHLPDGAESVGPWEDPLVQRATELDLGVRLPSNIDLTAVWTGPPSDPGAAATAALADRLRLRLGIP